LDSESDSVCVILDANRFGDALSSPPHADFAPLVRWVTSPHTDGAIVFGGKKFKREIARSATAQRWFATLMKAGRAIAVSDSEVDALERTLAEREACGSDDEHVIALANVSGARVVCSEDRALMTDLKNRKLVRRPKVRIYRKATHVALLRHDKCCQRPPRRRGR
jgi:hypothetical protein